MHPYRHNKSPPFISLAKPDFGTKILFSLTNLFLRRGTMKKSTFFSACLVVISIVLLGCQGQPSNPLDAPLPESGPTTLAKATTVTDNFSIPVSIQVFVPCAAGGAGELIEVSGPLHIVSHTTVNENNFSTKIHFQPQGLSGTGFTTGDKYQGTGVTQEHFGGSFVNGQFSDTFVNNFRMIGEGPDNNFTVHETFHVTVNANGTLTAFVDNFKTDCK
jgi:hypothetical protein